MAEFETVLDFYTKSTDEEFTAEFRPNIRYEDFGPNPNRVWPYESWTQIKKLKVPKIFISSQELYVIHAIFLFSASGKIFCRVQFPN